MSAVARQGVGVVDERHRQVLAGAAVDLLWGSTCAGCSLPGPRLCADCRSCTVPHPWVAWPTPSPPGLPMPVAAAVYETTLRELLVGFKEHQRFDLKVPLGRMLAASVEHLLDRTDVGRPLLLVPVPSSLLAVRSRGHDAVLGLARTAAKTLRHRGVDASAHQLLRQHRGVADQAKLGSDARQQNLRDALVALAPDVRTTGLPVVVVDDVITTGSSALEAARALRTAGWAVCATAMVAATPRRGGRGPGDVPVRLPKC